jgi:phosphoethanolamine N-methyltransferase
MTEFSAEKGGGRPEANPEEGGGQQPVAGDLATRYTRHRVVQSEALYGEGFQSSGTEQLARDIASKYGFEPGERIVDLGCGTGGVARLFALEYGASVTGVDLSADNIAICNERYGEGKFGDLRFIQGDFRDVRLAGLFNRLWTCQSLLYVQDKVSCLRNVQIHIIPKGKESILIDYTAGEGAHSRAFEEYSSDCGFKLPTTAEYRDMIERAGYQVLDVVDYTEAFQERMELEVAALQARQAEFEQDYTSEEFEQIVTRWQRKIDFCKSGELKTTYFVAQAIR